MRIPETSQLRRRIDNIHFQNIHVINLVNGLLHKLLVRILADLEHDHLSGFALCLQRLSLLSDLWHDEYLIQIHGSLI